MNDLEWERFDPCRRGVRLLPGLKQGGETNIHNAEGIQARVNGPHPGERLPHAS